MLDNVDKKGNVTWICAGLGNTCKETITYHLNHDDMQFVRENEIVMPACQKCGTRMTIYVHGDHELLEPIITKDAITGKILQAADNPHPDYRDNIWIKHTSIVHTPMPHPTLAHLSVEQIKELQALNRSKAPDMPLDWMLTESIHEEIHSVTMRPFVEHHRSLAEQMKTAGKGYVPQPESIHQPSATELLEKKINLLISTINALGIPALHFDMGDLLKETPEVEQDTGDDSDTTPRLPAVNPTNGTT